MTYNAKMKKFSILIFCLFFSIILVNGQGSKFPYNLPMTSETGLTLKKFTGTDTDGNGVTLPSFSSEGMTLSKEKVYNSFATAYFSNLKFSTTRGFVIEFEYVVYTNAVSTKNDVNKRSNIGDGFALVLFDGSLSASNVVVGSRGSGLGYAYNRSSTPTNNVPGFSGGYLGIGFDSYGQYKDQSRTVPTADWRTGIPDNSGTTAYIGPSKTNYVTVRGPVNTSLNSTYGENKAGYPVLISQNTIYATKPSSTNYYSQLSSDSWDATTYTNAYTKQEQNTFTPFLIGGGQNPTYLSSSYRKARIEMIPESSGSSVFYLNVYVIIDSETSPRKVINNYKIDTNSSVTYPEVKNYQLVAKPYLNIDKQTVSMKSPATLNMGWTAATGDAWGNTIIRKAAVTLPYVPIVGDDEAKICTKVGYSVDLNPLANDYGYDNNVSPLVESTPSVNNLNKSSFRFMIPTKTSGQIGYDANPTQYVYKGTYATYTYNKDTGIITAVTTAAATDGQTELVYYDIKDNSRNDDDDRSKVATITYTFLNSECKTATVLPNPVATDDNASICNTSGSSLTLNPLNNDTGYAFNSGGGISSGSSFLNVASFAFSSSTGVTVSNNGTTATTSNATYSYSTTTGVLTVKATKDVTTGTKDVLLYTVTNKSSTTRSNTAKINVTFDNSQCAAPSLTPASAGLLKTPSYCFNAGTTQSFYALKNSKGYAIVGNQEVQSDSYIDKTSFMFRDENGNPISNLEYTSSFAKYTYDPTTGYITFVVLNTGSGKQEDDVYFTIRNAGSSVTSSIGIITVTYNSASCKLTDIWIKINGPRKGFFINGMGELPPVK